MPRVTIKQLSAQPTAVIRATTAPATIAETLGDVFTTTWQAVAESGRNPVGPPFARWLNHGTDEVELEGGLPVDGPFTGSGRVVASSLPGGEAASLDYFGNYDGVRGAYIELEQWLADAGRQAAGPPWEVYWTDPGTEPDPAKWRTEVLVPLAPSARD